MKKLAKMAMTVIILTIIMAMVAACAPAATQTPTAAPAPAKTLTMWTWKVAHVAGLEAIAKNFEAKTGTKVTITAYNPDEVYRTKITTASQSGDLPDVLSYWSGGQWELAATGSLVELTSKVDDAWKANFLAGTYDKVSVMAQDKFDACAADAKCTFSNIKF